MSDTPLVWQWVRNMAERGSRGENWDTTRCHSRRAARSLATSMKKFMPMAKKNDRRPANLSMSSPRSRA